MQPRKETSSPRKRSGGRLGVVGYPVEDESGKEMWRVAVQGDY
jgi:hypothetical protein